MNLDPVPRSETLVSRNSHRTALVANFPGVAEAEERPVYAALIQQMSHIPEVTLLDDRLDFRR